GQIRLWLARFERRVIAGVICFYHNRHAAWWHSASDQLGRSLHANHVLQYHIIRDACERGYHFYDLLPSGGLENVVQFKNGFSPQRKTIRMYMSPPMLAARAVRGILRNTVPYRALMRGKGF
ncbi:MAG TPA: GNAT family N-acetyltransferase, partial [Anaerolineae bacterium]|nr:GNAT family N-acetyltransferase [Anaerolineae bacterium]